MKIKEQDGQRMVITPSSDDWGSTKFILVIAIAIGTLPTIIMVAVGMSLNVESDSGILMLVAGFLLLGVGTALYALGKVVGKRVVIDRSTQTIIIEKRPFLLIHIKSVVSFSDVITVAIDEAALDGPSGPADKYPGWKVSIVIANRKFKIDHTGVEAKMRYLAEEIGKFIGKETANNLADPDIMANIDNIVENIIPVIEGYFTIIERVSIKVKRFFTKKKRSG